MKKQAFFLGKNKLQNDNIVLTLEIGKRLDSVRFFYAFE